LVRLSIPASIKSDLPDPFPSSLQTIDPFPSSLQTKKATDKLNHAACVKQQTKIIKHFMNRNEHTVQSLEKLSEQIILIKMTLVFFRKLPPDSSFFSSLSNLGHG
jgi:hypothetical protein